MFKKIILAVVILVVVAIAGLLIAILMQPDELKVVRSANFDAKPHNAYGQVNDFQKWAAWSPWEKMDPGIKRTLSGEASGVGAEYSWIGNDQVGEGKMTITEVKPFEMIKIDLEFIKPFESRNVTEFTFVPEGDQTKVTWSMTGPMNFMTKTMYLFMDMDRMIGADFETGLAQMKPIAEADAKVDAEAAKNAEKQAESPTEEK